MSRFLKKLKKGLDSIMAPAEDPRETYLNTFDRQKNLLARVQKALLEIGKVKDRLTAKSSKVRIRLAELEESARQSLQDSREDLARLALQRYQLIRSELVQLETQMEEIEQEESRLWLTEQRLSNQIEAYYTRLEFAAARYNVAEAQVLISEAMGGVSEELAELGRAMEQVERKSEKMQARAAAIDELVGLNILDGPGMGKEDDWSIYQPETAAEIDGLLQALKEDKSLS